jgi:hypothetical protein
MGTKIIKSNSTSGAGVVVSENTVRATVNEDNSVMVAENGVTISGPVSLVSSPAHIRVGGLWTFNTPYNMMLPSTYATPAATLTVNPPIKQFKTIMEDASIMMGLLASLSSL